jgi:dTDP-4-amino-4,6-dideoxygalactose transaminase
MMNSHNITKEFELALAEYCGSPYCVAVDNCSNAIYLSLCWLKKNIDEVGAPYNQYLSIPKHTYVSLPSEIIRAGFKPRFVESDKFLTGSYPIGYSSIWDSALRFTADMYIPYTYQCLSFTGPYKHLKLGKGGAILTDNEHAYKWLKKARFSGRGECSYFEDNFDDNPVLGINAYMLPEIAARGLQLMAQFYNRDGSKKHNEDLSLEYPDLSKFQLWKS